MYGNAIKQYPVTPGSVWGAGPHRFLCGDVLQFDRDGILQTYVPQVKAVVTDPPWNDGNMKMFHTLAKRGAPSFDFSTFLSSLVNLIDRYSAADSFISIVMGMKSHDFLLNLLEKHSFYLWSDAICTYGKPPRPCRVVSGSFRTFGEMSFPDKLHGRQAIGHILDYAVNHERSSFFDPCCGQLIHTREAIRRGATAYGCELIPEKLAAGLKYLSSIGYDVREVYHS